MEIRRYKKNFREKAERVDTSLFVAFWADEKFVWAMDGQGVEWLLMNGTTLIDIEAGTPGVMRVHRGALVKVEEIERLTSRSIPGRCNLYFCTLRGRDLAISRRYRNQLHMAYHEHLGNRQRQAQQVAA